MMVRFLGCYAALAALLGTFVTSANAGTLFDQDVTPDVIFGSGNANGGFTVDRNNGIELGLRAKLRFDDSNSPQNTFNSNGDGSYTFMAGQPAGGGFGFDSGSSSTAVWNFEWSINTDFEDEGNGIALDDLTYSLEIDFDPGAATDFLEFDPINVPFADHAIGDNSTPNGGGTVTSDANDYQSLISSKTVAQNSWNMEFFDDAGSGFPFNANVPGSFVIRLTASQVRGPIVTQLAQTEITVNSVVVPEPASMLSFAALGACVAFGTARSVRRRRSAA